MARRLFGKLKTKQPPWKPLSDVLDGQNVKLPLLLKVDRSSEQLSDVVCSSYGCDNLSNEAWLFTEQKTRLSYVRIEVVELPGQPHVGDSGTVVQLMRHSLEKWVLFKGWSILYLFEKQKCKTRNKNLNTCLSLVLEGHYLALERLSSQCQVLY